MINSKLVQFTNEDNVGEKWLEFYHQTIKGYRHWFLQEGEFSRPGIKSCQQAIQQYMPEFESLWLSLIELTGADDLDARLLSFYCPAPYVSGCSQAVWTRYNPILVRNYDYNLDLSEMRVLKSKWFDTEVIASTDCLWGVLDGMNEYGLCISLSFGGIRDRGEGFGIPIILRYILEFCKTTEEAISVLERVPSNMSYNITIIDAYYTVNTVELHPYIKPIVSHIPLAVNHQGEYELTEYAIFSKSYERKKFLIDKLYDPMINIENFIDSFEYMPLFTDNYKQSFGTIYTAIYNPTLMATEFRWPYGVRRYKSFSSFEEESFWVTY